MEHGTCKGCGRPIIWGRLKNNSNGVVKSHPFDTPPAMRIVVGDDGVGVVRPTYSSHFSTCPKAEFFRSSKPGPASATAPDHKVAAANDDSGREGEG